MSHGLKLLLIAAGAIITCIVVVVGFNLTKSGKSDTNKASEQFTTITTEYDDVKLSSYDGLTLSGADVITCFSECDSLLCDSNYIFTITVKTKMNTSGLTYEGVGTSTNYPGTASSGYAYNIDSANKSTKENYINPTAQFVGSITRNDNGIIENITFTQQ